MQSYQKLGVFYLGLLALALTGTEAQSKEPVKSGVATPVQARQAIDRGLGFLARDAVAWKKEHDCSSCHHAAMVVWSMNEAKARGHAVEEPVLADLTKWLTEAGEGKTSLPRPDGVPKALNSKAVYYALGLSSVPDSTSSQRDALKLLLRTVAGDQTDNGSWASWPETRPPFFGNSDQSMTALATLALLPEVASEDRSAKTAVDKSIDWLERTRSDDDPQSVAMRLVLYSRLERPRPEWLPLVRRIQKRQRRDGGWSQTLDGPSDAWATGQALYALSHAGTASDKRVLARGRAFLVSTQREDGSWPMASRPVQKPGGKGADNLIPIIGGGSAWAVLGLARSDSRSGATPASASKPAR